jgi:hypothetical protein
MKDSIEGILEWMFLTFFRWVMKPSTQSACTYKVFLVILFILHGDDRSFDTIYTYKIIVFY